MRLYNVISSNEKLDGVFIKEYDVNELLTRICVGNNMLPQSVSPQVFDLLLASAFTCDKEPMIHLATPQFGNFDAVRLSLVLSAFECLLGLEGDDLTDLAVDSADAIYDLYVEEDM